MNRFPANALTSLLTILALVLSLRMTAQPDRPNIIYIMTDDMGYGDLSCYGQKAYTTPNLDKLASQGVKFVNAYAAAPVCTPTRAAFMTGRYPAKTSVGLMEPLRAPQLDSAYGLTPDIPSIAALMKESGYETALIGKWHLGFMPHQSPIENGFDYFFGIHSGAADYISHRGANGTRTHDLYENETMVHPEGYLTDLLTERSIAFLRKKHDKPFFLSLNYTAPHWPWQGLADMPYPDSVDFRAGGSSSVYEEMMKCLDDGIGKIMQALDDLQLSDQTIVIFTNDNGGEHYSDNGGLSSGKMNLWEGGIRVPAFVRWPGRIGAGIVTQQVAVTMDWTVTILNAGNAKADQDFPLDGIDLMPVLTGRKDPIDRTLYWRITQRNMHSAVRDGNWKYLKDENGEYLFDLNEDPEEKKNLRMLEEKRFEELKSKYAEWEKTVLKPVALTGR